VSAQETAPVTVIVQFEQPAVEAFGGSGGGNLAASTISAAGVTSLMIFNQVVLPRVESKIERETRQEELTQQLPQRPRTFGGMFRYEHVDFEKEASGLDGNICNQSADGLGHRKFFDRLSRPMNIWTSGDLMQISLGLFRTDNIIFAQSHLYTGIHGERQLCLQALTIILTISILLVVV
jgi:hypothetical protein